MNYIEIKSEKEYLANVPVRINIWIRPECQKAQFEIIKAARPRVLFIQSDGGRDANERSVIEQNRLLIDEGIDWHCEVYRFYEEKNQGLYKMSSYVVSSIFSIVDRCIFLEDDQIPSVSFFRYCEILLEKYKDDERIECICGMNHLGVYGDPNADYFFSRQGSIWGIAFWKRVWDEWGNYDYINNTYSMRVLKERTKHNNICWKRLNAYGRGVNYEGHVAGSEFWIEFDMYFKNRLQIVPKYNMISNIGATRNSEHFDDFYVLPSRVKKIFYMKTYEVDFELKHPLYVMPDLLYEKKRNRIMLYNSNNYFIKIFEIGEVIFYKIVYKFKLLFKGKVNYESNK